MTKMQQQIQPLQTTVLTPIEQLLAEKAELKVRCRKQEEKLNDDFTYIRENASGLLLSGLSLLLFSSGSNNRKGEKPSTVKGDAGKNTAYSIYDYINIAKGLLPVAWEVIQPLVITWGINKAKSLLWGLFSKKKKS